VFVGHQEEVEILLEVDAVEHHLTVSTSMPSGKSVRRPSHKAERSYGARGSVEVEPGVGMARYACTIQTALWVLADRWVR
jgi:hypothetical protein